MKLRIDAGYGNNSTFLSALEKRQLKYLGGIAKNRKVTVSLEENSQETYRVDELAESLSSEAFKEIQLNINKPRTLWVVTIEVEMSGLSEKKVWPSL